MKKLMIIIILSLFFGCEHEERKYFIMLSVTRSYVYENTEFIRDNIIHYYIEYQNQEPIDIEINNAELPFNKKIYLSDVNYIYFSLMNMTSDNLKMCFGRSCTEVDLGSSIVYFEKEF